MLKWKMPKKDFSKRIPGLFQYFCRISQISRMLFQDQNQFQDYPGLPRTFQDSGHPVIRMRSWNPEILGFWVVEKQSSAEWRKSKRSVSMPSRQIVLTLQVWSREHEAMWARIEPTIPMWTSSTDIEWSDNTCNGAWRNSDDVVFSDVIHDWRTLVMMMMTRK